MQISSLKLFTSLSIFASIGLIVLMVSHKPKESSSVVVEHTSNSTSSFYERAELSREQEHDEKIEAEKRAKLSAAKQNSVECQFWKQQQLQTPSKRAEEKISQLCDVQPKTPTEDTK